MGTSTNALLWFGVVGGERHECLSGDAPAEEWEQNIREVLEKHGCSLIVHCSYSYPEYGIAISSLSHTASRGYPKQIALGEPTEHQRLQLSEALKIVGWQGDTAAGWHLASLWGV